MNINQQTKKIKQREIDFETEIPIWFNGQVKWISNLRNNSKCSDVIEAILTSLDNRLRNLNEDFVLCECWRGVERELKSRCRLLKLWKSWNDQSKYLILTLRLKQQQNIKINFIIQKQEEKLKKLKNKTNKIINKLNKYQQNEFNNLLFDINQTFISTRNLTYLSNQFQLFINEINQQIDKKQMILDDLEFDLALQEQFSYSTIPIESSTVSSRPFAIIEPNQSPSLLNKLNKKEILTIRPNIEFLEIVK